MNRRNRQHRKQSAHHRSTKPVNQQQQQLQQQLSPNSTLKRRNLALRSSHPQTGQATSAFASKERGERVSLLSDKSHISFVAATKYIIYWAISIKFWFLSWPESIIYTRALINFNVVYHRTKRRKFELHS